MKLLLVEDNIQDQDLCKTSVCEFNEDSSFDIELEICGTVEDALIALKSSYFDGAIIDMKLADDGNEGNAVIQRIMDSFQRIPIAIMTGTPDAVQLENSSLINKFLKGETEYFEIIKILCNIYQTGLTKIMGGRGFMERNLSEIFTTNLLPQIKKWEYYGELDPDKTEKALLRHTLNHLIHFLDDDLSSCYPEEFYIYPSKSSHVNTGGIWRERKSRINYIVMSPACDLAERSNGECNTDRAMFLEIETLQNRFPEFFLESPSKNVINQVKSAYKNSKNNYHWLPETQFFNGGFINFRSISTYKEQEIIDKFEYCEVQVSPAFVKDMVSRFSSYYARQGQPDIDYSVIL